ncbi:aspartyl-phosphate phosphatase Spo0E family protein [Paenibacillus sp. 11B]|uniref:aspartyl-phosphate phosphatase Spo0E family protein n=1 Tax=Paenibacillus sp. 11B TaxID=3060965 RepID=UPI00265679E9|nr:aspartyl-phosphate phosphatase Spo0E family protein [Paenibacillus sp. 11B]MDN8593190.1 aspartyl-phosphate phosphatase Spo0E family protein [Paenibacillus sp. 11B]
MDKPTDICEEIEIKRLEMHEAGTVHGLMSPEVLRVSQELDLLLNDFNKRLNRECG